MRIEFTANMATFNEINETLVAGLADGDEPEAYLLFQRSVVDGPDDWGVHLEHNDQVNSGYNLISACRVTRDRLEVDLSAPLGNIGGVEGFDVLLHVDDSTYDRFADGLTKVFKGEARALLSLAQQ